VQKSHPEGSFTALGKLGRAKGLALSHKLERFLIELNLRGFPWREISDSRCGLVKEASLHDETSFE
jgi:hypothetical protein